MERKKQLVRDQVSRLVNWGHWFAFFNGLLAMLVGVRYLATVGFPDNLIGWGYLAISTLGHFTFLAFIVYLVLLFPVTLILPYSRILRGYAAIVATIGICALLYDTVIYGEYGMHLSPFAFDLAFADLNSLLQGASVFITPLVVFVIELILANGLWKRIDRIQRRNVGNKLVAAIGICFVSSHLVHIWADAADVTAVTRFDDAYPISYPATAKTFMENHGIDGSSSVVEPFQKRLNYPQNPLQCRLPQNRHPNVLIVAIDSFRADQDDMQTMPFFHQFAAQNMNFTEHYSGGNQFNSGMFSLLYGLQGSYMDSDDLDYTSPLLTQTFKQEHYAMAMFSVQSNLETAKPDAIFKDFEMHIADESLGSAMADIRNIDSFNQWRRQQSGQWFALLNLRAPEDYDTPVGFLGVQTVKSDKTLKPAQKVLFNQYRQSLNFIDQQLKQLIEALPKDTVIVVAGVNGKVFTSSSDEARHDLSPTNVKVPLVIHWPDTPSAEVNYRSSHYGIVPTLMTQVLGCTNAPTDYSAGRHLLQPDDSTWLYVGDNRVFAIYQQHEITVIDRHGKYRIYNADYSKRLRKKMSAPELLDVMREGRRLYNH
ncbi:DUF3413 domain-containing protein [Shewanella avicenniae]|uniref:DUF3413 domain-containing protein n=1 Tax=Shewanella avicenniae TaxID=2814294 RepID=A0ABX7QMH4_9GAMM|nr:DUF3413 domain-containing protein [Shewanella avicenniae]QSX32098.1 DUF3413 domain-containing protein [Shewanella avicenniae]